MFHNLVFWDENRKSGEVTIDESGQKATCNSKSGGHHWAISKNELTNGRHTWTLQFGKRKQGIGIVSKQKN